MDKREKIAQLRGVIERGLGPLLSGDCVLLDCPYYANVGDTLIWEGELAFLREQRQRLIGYGSFHTWLFPRLDSGVVVLLNGGGSFGDLWREAQEFRLKVIEAYPTNRIVILPQSVHYDDAALVRRDAEIMARHPQLTICARDTHSESILREHFRNDVILLPDMAFCLNTENLSHNSRAADGALMIRREDKEALAADFPAAATVADWPTMKRTAPVMWVINKLSGLCEHGIMVRAAGALADRLAMNTMRQYNIRKGVELLLPYRTIYSTRLHGAILSILLDKPETFIFDNSYGKNSSFYRTWLQDIEGVHLL